MMTDQLPLFSMMTSGFMAVSVHQLSGFPSEDLNEPKPLWRVFVIATPQAERGRRRDVRRSGRSTPWSGLPPGFGSALTDMTGLARPSDRWRISKRSAIMPG